MTHRAECDEIVHCIVAEPASFHQVMKLQVFERTTTLTAPPIAFHNSSMKQLVFFAAQLQSRTLLAQFRHIFE
jgi:hypothetical protein